MTRIPLATTAVTITSHDREVEWKNRSGLAHCCPTLPILYEGSRVSLLFLKHYLRRSKSLEFECTKLFEKTLRIINEGQTSDVNRHCQKFLNAPLCNPFVQKLTIQVARHSIAVSTQVQISTKRTHEDILYLSDMFTIKKTYSLVEGEPGTLVSMGQLT
jgi:hypothetical protein